MRDRITNRRHFLGPLWLKHCRSGASGRVRHRSLLAPKDIAVAQRPQKKSPVVRGSVTATLSRCSRRTRGRVRCRRAFNLLSYLCGWLIGTRCPEEQQSSNECGNDSHDWPHIARLSLARGHAGRNVGMRTIDVIRVSGIVDVHVVLLLKRGGKRPQSKSVPAREWCR